MSTYTRLISAQMSTGQQTPIPDNTLNTSFKNILPRQLSKDLIASFDIPSSPSIRELCDLQVELDHQILQKVAGIESETDATWEANLAKGAALILSGPMVECGHEARSEFQQIQLRALISSLALLHRTGVAALDSNPWDKLRIENIPARFQNIAYQMKSNLSIAERILHAPNVYLIQLASQYMSFFRRGDSVVPSLVGPAVKIIFATISIVSSFIHTELWSQS